MRLFSLIVAAVAGFWTSTAGAVGTLQCVDSRNLACHYQCRMIEDDVYGCGAVTPNCMDVGNEGMVEPITGTKRGFIVVVNFGTLTCKLVGSRAAVRVPDPSLDVYRQAFGREK